MFLPVDHKMLFFKKKKIIIPICVEMGRKNLRLPYGKLL